jgi:hypothetical protein
LRSFEGLALEELALKDMGDVSDAELRRIGEYRQLKSLSITQFFPDRDLEPIGNWGNCIANLTELETLRLEDVSFDEASLTAIGALPRLKHLKLSGIDNEGAAELGGLTHLETLELPLGIGDRGIARLHAIQSLTIFTAHGELTDASCAWIAKNRQLRELELGNALITDRGLDAIVSLPYLELLNLRSSQLTDKGMNKLATLTRLRYLNVSGKGITDDGLRQLHPLYRLETLALQETSVTQAGIEAADRFPRLERLFLGDVKLDTASIQNFNARMKASGRRLELSIGRLN